METQIKAALIRFNDAIKNADGSSLSASLTELESLLAAHGSALHPQLRHFLEGRSYAKALAWLGSGELLAARPASPPGGCGGGHA